MTGTDINQDIYNRLTPYKFYWEALRRDGSLTSIAPHELEIMAVIYKELIGMGLNGSCSECIKDMVVYLGVQYRKFESSIPKMEISEPETMEPVTEEAKKEFKPDYNAPFYKLSRRQRRQQADQLAKKILRNPPSEDMKLPSGVFKALRKRLNKKG